MTRESGKTYIDRLKQVPAVMLFAVGGAALAGCGSSAEHSPVDSSSVEADQTAEHVSTDASEEIILPDAYTFGPLDQMDEGEWNFSVNNGLLAQMSTWLDTQVKNPNVNVPVDSFTETPDSALITELQSLSEKIVEARPEGATNLYAGICGIATDYNGGPTDVTGFSDLTKNPDQYPEGSSYLTAYYEWEEPGDDAHDRSDRETVRIPVSNGYSITQTPKGAILINSAN